MERVVDPLVPDDHLLEQILSTENVRKAWKQVPTSPEYSADTGNRSLAAPTGADVLLETVALLPHQGTQTAQARNFTACCYLGWPQPKRPVASGADVGHAKWHDQAMAQGSRIGIRQGTMGEHSLSGYGPMIFMNRPVRTRMRGGVGAGG